MNIRNVIKRVNIKDTERGFAFQEGNFKGILGPGVYWKFDPFNRWKVNLVSLHSPRINVGYIDQVIRSGELDGIARVLDLKDYERALVWVNGRFLMALGPGKHAFWTIVDEVEVEIVDSREVQFEHKDLKAIITNPFSHELLDVYTVGQFETAPLYINGRFEKELSPGVYAFWSNAADVKVHDVEFREQSMDVGGQEIMTADRVTMRLNATLTYKVTDARKSVESTWSLIHSLYREAQFALRDFVGKRELDELLTDKESASAEVFTKLKSQGENFGVSILGFGIKDIILPGEMKEILNQVMEAKKSAEASLINRREETSSIRHQANTAKVFANNPALMRLRELEVLEKVAASGKLTVFTGDKLAEKVTNLI